MAFDARLDGYVPTRHVFEAALRTARCLDHDDQPVELFRSTLAHLPTDGVYSLEHLLDGEEVLVRAGVAERRGSAIRLVQPSPRSVELLGARYLEQSPPAWLGAATRNTEVDYDMVPTKDADTLSDVLGDPDRRDALLMALGQVFDDTYRQELGRAGELAVIRACQTKLREIGAPELAEDVLHASLVSDRLGYDVRTPTVGGGVLRLEVKTDASAGSGNRCYLSRNEWETGTRDRSWRLVVCRREPCGELVVAGWTAAATLAAYLPQDTGRGRWQAAELSFPDGALAPGLPDLSCA